MDVSFRPYLTQDLPGVGGRIKSHLEDFQVEEVPKYTPGGEGQHAYLWLEKRGVASGELLSRLSSHFGVKKRDMGTAGNKDKEAVTRQWISLPFHELEADDPADLVGPIDEDIDVLEADLHRNKLRTGHHRGNRFRVVIRDLEVEPDEAIERATRICEKLREVGMLNYYGLQRFGHGGSTLQLGVGFLRGDDEARSRLRGNHFLKRLAASAAQSEVFNRVVAARLQREILWTVFDGDVVKKTDTGGVFVIPSDEHEECQNRLDRGELVTTGPMPGPEMIAPERDGADFEDGVLAEAGLDAELFERHRRLTPGTRRRTLVQPEELSVELDETGESAALIVRFFLPAGSYATVLLREIIDRDDPR
ncbi:MAG: tRNA pseudouridine(13) synthase TruD [Persicimonas sp.]